MRVSAIVLNWKDTRRTMRCVSSLAASSHLEHVYVVDNESSGELRAELKHLDCRPGLTWSLTEMSTNLGFAGAINVALEQSLASDYDATLVINNDAFIDDLSIFKLFSALESDPSTGLVAPKILHLDGTEESSGGYLNPFLGTAHHKHGSKRSADFATWACILVRSKALKEVGLLDERFFMYWEDIDISLRFHEAGWRTAICESAAAHHEVSTNRQSYPTAIKAYHTWSAILFAKKHGGLWRLGRLSWILQSFSSNVLMLRFSKLRGLYLGTLLAREKATPASSSILREKLFR